MREAQFMKRWMRLVSALLSIVILLSVGYASELAGGVSSYDSNYDASYARAYRPVAGVSVEEKFGQVVMIGFRKWVTAEEIEQYQVSPAQDRSKERPEATGVTALNDEIRDIIARNRLGSIILFGMNCTDAAALANGHGCRSSKRRAHGGQRRA